MTVLRVRAGIFGNPEWPVEDGSYDDWLIQRLRRRDALMLRRETTREVTDHTTVMPRWVRHPDPGLMKAWKRACSSWPDPPTRAAAMRQWCLDHLGEVPQIEMWDCPLGSNEGIPRQDALRGMILFADVAQTVLAMLAWPDAFEATEDLLSAHDAKCQAMRLEAAQPSFETP